MDMSNITNKVKILIVEDEYILAMNLQESLEFLGYSVMGIVDSAEGAIKQATEFRPTLVLMDIRLKGEEDGITAAEQIWNHLQIPVIYVTGHSDRSTVERATLTFPFGYILKPVREQELYVAIQTALTRYEREQFLSSVLRGMGDAVVVVDTQLRVKYLNAVAERLTGWSLDLAKDHAITDVAPLVDEETGQAIETPTAVALRQDTTIYLSGRTLLMTKTGTALPVSDSATPLRAQNGELTGSVMVFRDDTQRRLAEERNLALVRAQQLELQMSELQRLNELKDDFLATTSHELRTPLSSIKLAICMLEALLNEQEQPIAQESAKFQSISRYLEVMRAQCDQELKLVNSLLDMRSLDADAYPFNVTSIQLQLLLPDIAEAFQDRVTQQQQALKVVVPPDMPPILSDASSLTRIVSELLHNACKYTPANGQIQLTAQLVEAAPPAAPESCLTSPDVLASSVDIAVSNSGVAIPSDELVRIFDPFYRIPSNDPWKHGGTGLGLSLVKKLVTHLQGTITVTSAQNLTTFTIQLPVSVPNR